MMGRRIVTERLRMLRRVRALRRQGVRVTFAGVVICPDSQLAENTLVSHHASVVDSVLGRWSGIGRYGKLQSADVGAFCSIAWDTTIGATAHPTRWATTHAFAYDPAEGGFVEGRSFESPRTTLGNDVWVGCNAVVLPGVSVGDGAIVGAGAVVTADVTPYEIVAGSPARVVGRRLEPEIARRVQELAWWSWPDPLLRQHVELFARPLDEHSLEALEAVRPS